MKKVPSVDYKNVALIKIFRNAKDDQMYLSIIYKKRGALYYKIRKENISKKFNGERIDMREESDFEYDEEGASDEKSKNELDKLISWSDFDSVEDL